MCGNFGLLLLHAASVGKVETLLRLMLKITQMCVREPPNATKLALETLCLLANPRPFAGAARSRRGW